MQAAQSNKASDFLRHHPTDPSGSGKTESQVKDLASSANAPIHLGPFQAARKYLERQRGSALAVEDSETGVRDARSYPQERSVPSLYGRMQTNRVQPSTEQDERLERSLYQGHSIEAGLSFEDSNGNAFFSVSDGSQPVFPYSDPYPNSDMSVVPDPAAVRDAILRLARKSGAVQDLSTPTPTFNQLEELTASSAQAGASDFAAVAQKVWGQDRGEGSSQISTVATDTSAAEPDITLPLLMPAAPLRPKEQRSNDIEDAALAHDACNLLSAVGLYGDLLSSPGVLDKHHRHYSEDLRLIAVRSRSLIDRLLRFGSTAKVERNAAAATAAAQGAGNLSMSVPSHVLFSAENPYAADGDATPNNQGAETTSMVDLLMRWGDLLSTIAEGTLDVSFGPHAAAPIPVAAEPLERILVNLVKNARAATIGGGAIRIGVGVTEANTLREPASSALRKTAIPELVRASSSPDRLIVLTVDDSGCGMSEAQVCSLLSNDACDRAGRSYKNSPEARLADGGHGLGLKVVKDLVAITGGSFDIQSRLGTGTRIAISWPVTASVSAPPVTAAGALEAPRRTTTSENSPNLAVGVFAESPSAITRQTMIGPDGFSEQELRGMMLRLHRGGPPEDRPVGTSMGSRAVAAEVLDRRRSVRRSSEMTTPPSSFNTDRKEIERLKTDKLSTGKGAIAC